MGFKKFQPRFKSSKTRFKLSAGLNLETFDIILGVCSVELELDGSRYVKSRARIIWLQVCVE